MPRYGDQPQIKLDDPALMFVLLPPAVDDDPWPGPSFTFPVLPGIDDVDALSGSRPSSLPEAQVQAALLMQLLHSIFNNGKGGEKPTSSNEVKGALRWQQVRYFL